MILIKDRHIIAIVSSDGSIPNGKYDTYKGSTLGVYINILQIFYYREI